MSEKLTGSDRDMVDRLMRGSPIKTLRADWARVRPMLLNDEHRGDADGAYARATLLLLPALITLIERDHQRQVKPRDTLDGIANATASLIHQAVIATMLPSEQRQAFDMVLHHIAATTGAALQSSRGGIILPN